MSMDFRKSVYVPVRNETRKVTSYGQMNVWHDFKTPLSLGKRPKMPHVKNNEPLGTGVEIFVPEPKEALADPGEITKQKLREIVAERNRQQIEQMEITKRRKMSPFNVKLKGKPLSPTQSPYEPLIVGGRIIRPDPMTVSAPVHLTYGTSGGYDDYHKTYMKLQRDGVYPSYPLYGPPRLHNGKIGGEWKHVKNVLQAKGSRTVFIDGTPRLLENNKMMGNEVPGVDIMYPVSMRKPTKAFTDPYKITQTQAPITFSQKEAIKQTEGGNWNLLR